MYNVYQQQISIAKQKEPNNYCIYTILCMKKKKKERKKECCVGNMLNQRRIFVNKCL